MAHAATIARWAGVFEHTGILSSPERIPSLAVSHITGSHAAFGQFSFFRPSLPLRKISTDCGGEWVPNGLEDVQCLFGAFNSLDALAQFVQHECVVKKQKTFAVPVANLAANHQRLLQKLDGLARLAQVVIGTAKIAEEGAFGVPVANLAADGERVLNLGW